MPPAGTYDDGGVLRCRATGKRCLSQRQAAEHAHRARRQRGEKVSEYRCRACTWWHFGHQLESSAGGGQRWHKGWNTRAASKGRRRARGKGRT